MIDDAELAPRLLESGVIDQPRLDQGIALTRSQGENLYNTLIRNKLVVESEIVGLVAGILNVPSIDLQKVAISAETLQLVPGSMAMRNKVIPIRIKQDDGGQQLVLGMADPIDVLAMDEIATHTGIDIRPVLVGPAELENALQTKYKNGHADDALDDMLDDLGDIALDVLEDENWENFFDEAQAIEFEDSASISQEMRDRPSSDVFEAVDEIASEVSEVPSLDMLEDDFDVSEPNPEAEDVLEDWDIDEAITSRKDGGVKQVPQKAQILSAYAAKNLFDENESGGEASIALPDPAEVEEEDDYVDEPTQRKSMEELSESLADDGDPPTGRTQIGVGVDEIAEQGAGSMSVGGKRNDKATAGNTDHLVAESLAELSEEDSEVLDTGSSKTQAGIGAHALKSDKRKKKEKKGFNKKPNSNTDYGALGRAILKKKTDDEPASGEVEEEVEGEDAIADETADEPVAQETVDIPTQDAVEESEIEPETGMTDEVETGVHEKEEDPETNVHDPKTNVHEPEEEEPPEEAAPGVQEISEPHTRDVPDASALVEEEKLVAEAHGNATAVGFLDQNNTREMDEADLYAAASGLSEDTAAAVIEDQRALLDEASFAHDDVAHTRETRKNQAITASQLQRGGTTVGKAMPAHAKTDVAVQALTEGQIQLDIPYGVSDRALLNAALKLLIANDLLDPEKLVQLAKDEAEKE